MARKPKAPKQAASLSNPLDFRPDTYWPQDSIRHALLGNIKGEVRRRILQASLETGDGDIPPAEILAPTLEPAMRSLLGGIHPMCMGGEYLPHYEGQSVEIARVAMRSTTGDVISVRATPEEEGWVKYQVVDEYGTNFKVPIPRSSGPLTLAEVIRTIDETERDEEDWQRGLVLPFLQFNAEWGNPEDLRGFITVSSEFYPSLTGHYKKVSDDYLDSFIEVEDPDED